MKLVSSADIFVPFNMALSPLKKLLLYLFQLFRISLLSNLVYMVKSLSKQYILPFCLNQLHDNWVKELILTIILLTSFLYCYLMWSPLLIFYVIIFDTKDLLSLSTFRCWKWEKEVVQHISETILYIQYLHILE